MVPTQRRRSRHAATETETETYTYLHMCAAHKEILWILNILCICTNRCRLDRYDNCVWCSVSNMHVETYARIIYLNWIYICLSYDISEFLFVLSFPRIGLFYCIDVRMIWVNVILFLKITKKTREEDIKMSQRQGEGAEKQIEWKKMNSIE